MEGGQGRRQDAEGKTRNGTTNLFAVSNESSTGYLSSYNQNPQVFTRATSAG